MARQQPEVRYTVRMPPALYDALRTLAEEGDRSINAQVLRILRANGEICREVERGMSTSGAG